MKKYFLIGLATMLIIAGVAIALKAQTSSHEFETDNEALAFSECLVSSDQKENIGKCKAKVDGTGDSCVEYWIPSLGNCFGDVNFDD